MACVLFFLPALALSFPSPSLGDCPLSGCTPSRSFSSLAGYLPTGGAPIHSSEQNPILLWSYKWDRPSGGGCSTNGGRVVCPLVTGQNASLVSLSADSATPPSSWSVSLSGNVTLPLMDLTGALVATDGYTLIGYYADGTPRGDPVQLFPTHGEVFDLNIALEKVVFILYRCGFIATYLTNGVPHAGLWLNDTINGTDGTFVPLGDPAINGSRVYIVAAFRPHVELSHNPLLTRLYAIDIRTTISQRIVIVWYMDISLDGYSIPYLSTSRTVCTSSSLGPAETPHSSVSMSEPPSRVMVQDGTVVASINLCGSSTCTPAGYSSKLFLVKDLGSGYQLLSEDCFSGDVTCLACLDIHEVMEKDDGLPDTLQERQSKEDLLQAKPHFWLLNSDTRHQTTLLEERDTSDGEVTRQVVLGKLLETKQVTVTTKLTIVYSNLQSAELPCISKLPCVEEHASVLLLGVSISNGSSSTAEIESGNPSQVSSSPNYILALDISDGQTIKLLWRLPLPPSEPAVGQIATVDVDRSEETIMVVTTSLGIYAYQL